VNDDLKVRASHLKYLRYLIGAIWFCLAFSALEMSSLSITNRQGHATRTVRNSDKPLRGERQVVLQKDLEIKSPIQDYKRRGYIGGLAFDAQNRIFLLDTDNGIVRVHDSKGMFLKTISVQKNLNGGISDLLTLKVDDAGKIFILGAKRMYVFDAKWNLNREIALSDFVYDFVLTPSSDWIVQLKTKERRKEIALLDKEGKKKKTISSIPTNKLVYVADLQGNTHVFNGQEHEFRQDCFFASRGEGEVVIGHSSEYKLTILDSAGNEVLIFSKEERSQTISSKEKGEIIRQLEDSFAMKGVRFSRDKLVAVFDFPDHKPFYQILLADEANSRVYAGKLIEGRKWAVDVFNKDGVYIYKLTLDFLPILKIAKDRLYSLARGDPSTVVTYRLNLD